MNYVIIASFLLFFYWKQLPAYCITGEWMILFKVRSIDILNNQVSNFYSWWNSTTTTTLHMNSVTKHNPVLQGAACTVLLNSYVGHSTTCSHWDTVHLQKRSDMGFRFGKSQGVVSVYLWLSIFSLIPPTLRSCMTLPVQRDGCLGQLITSFSTTNPTIIAFKGKLSDISVRNDNMRRQSFRPTQNCARSDFFRRVTSGESATNR